MTYYHAIYAAWAALLVLAVAVPLRTRSVFAGLALIVAVPLMLSPWGKPRPIWSAIVGLPECRPDTSPDPSSILATQVREDEGRILLWLQVAACEPTAYEMPWTAEMAEQLQKALEDAERNGTGAMLRYEPSLEGREPKAYAPPQPALPPKPPGSAPQMVPEEAA